MNFTKGKQEETELNHPIDAVFPMPDFVLGCKFKNGAILLYDLKPVFQTAPTFLQLMENPEQFPKATVAPEGYSVTWTDDLDLSCDEIWKNGWPEWKEEELVTVEIEIELDLIQKLEEILRPFSLVPEDWIVMALEYLVCPATKDQAEKWLLQEKQANLGCGDILVT